MEHYRVSELLRRAERARRSLEIAPARVVAIAMAELDEIIRELRVVYNETL